jgi:anti-anti-sigma factor
MDELFTIRLETVGDATVLHFQGALDLYVRDALEAALDTALRETSGVLHVDLEYVTFLDSTALRELLLGRMRARRNGVAFAVSRMSSAVEKVLTLAGSYDELTEELLVRRAHPVGD